MIISLNSIHVLEIKTSKVFNSVFATQTILSCFFFFFVINDLNFLISVVIELIFVPTEELKISIWIPTKEAKVGIETHPITTGAKINVFNMI